MKRTKLPIALIAMALIFACVLSCDEQEEKIKINDELVLNTFSNGRVGNLDLNGSEGDPIDLVTAQRWTANYRGTLKSAEDTQGHYFGFEIIQQILNETDCVGIRIYYGMDDVGNKQLMLVGVNAAGENLLPIAGGKVAEGNIIGDASLPCPTYCP